MSVGEYCNREVVVVERTEPVSEAVQLMRKHHVGSVVVVRKNDDKLLPVGILTDRDLVVEVIAANVNPETLLAQDVMSFNLVSANEAQEMWQVAGLMQGKGIRRIPIVDRDGFLVGIFSMDDVLEIVTAELSSLARLADRERNNEALVRQ